LGQDLIQTTSARGQDGLALQLAGSALCFGLGLHPEAALA